MKKEQKEQNGKEKVKLGKVQVADTILSLDSLFSLLDFSTALKL